MNTDNLVDALGREPPRPSPFISMAIPAATLIALVLVVTVSLTVLKPREDLTVILSAHHVESLLKLAFALAVVATALPIVRDLSIPGKAVRGNFALAAIPFVVVVALALHQFVASTLYEWSHHGAFTPWRHDSWRECLWQIPALAALAFVVLAVTVRRLAPTNLVRVGAYVGLLSGGIGALGYAFHCQDDNVAFVAFSYAPAILEMVLVGALLGPRILRW